MTQRTQGFVVADTDDGPLTVADIRRLMAVDAADKARRAKISAKALEREATRRQRCAQTGTAAAEVPGLFAGGGSAGQVRAVSAAKSRGWW